MSRSTQYIGLNDYALAWIKKQGVIEKFPTQVTEGMLGEPVYGNIYHLNPPDGPNVMYIAEEVVQAIPWSSGPMVFTCLKVSLLKMEGNKSFMGRYHEWMIDPTLEVDEFDRATGRYYV